MQHAMFWMLPEGQAEANNHLPGRGGGPTVGPTAGPRLLPSGGLPWQEPQASDGAVMSHLASRVLAIGGDGRPYELRDVEGKPVSTQEAGKLILSKYQVPKEIRRE